MDERRRTASVGGKDRISAALRKRGCERLGEQELGQVVGSFGDLGIDAGEQQNLPRGAAADIIRVIIAVQGEKQIGTGDLPQAGIPDDLPALAEMPEQDQGIPIL